MSQHLDPRALAAARRDAIRRRARRIRRSVAGFTLALFTAAFLAVYVQLAAGHDPGLTTTTKQSTSAPSATEVSTGEPGTSSESNTAGSEETGPSPSAVTTGQS